MGQSYTVKPGDYLAKIASDHGFADIGKIVQDEYNRDILKKRDPNILYAGDQLYIPDIENKRQEPCETNRKHCFQLAGTQSRIIIQFIHSENQPAPLANYVLKIGNIEYQRSLGEQAYQGNLDQGMVNEGIPHHETEADLDLVLQAEPETTYNYHLLIGYMDPISEITGVQARLNNLGYDCGPVDGFKGPRTEKAVKQFQWDKGLKVDGLPGPITQAKLKEIYGS